VVGCGGAEGAGAEDEDCGWGGGHCWWWFFA
jgi:hypothetical protein